MEHNETDKASKIEQLRTFPFKSFQEYKKASFEGTAKPTVGIDVALKCARRGIYTSKLLQFQTHGLLMLMYLTMLGFIVFTIVTKNWWFFLTIPVFIICFFVFHPINIRVLKPIRNFIMGLILIGFVWSTWTSKEGLHAMTISLLIIWFAETRIYKYAVHGLINAANNHEDLFCKLWEGNILSIRFYNGDTYYSDHKFEKGNYIYYEK